MVCSQVKHLSLHFNALTALPGAIGSCTSLEWLSLNANQLTRLPPEICQLHQLARLSVHINQVSGSTTAGGALLSLSLHVLYSCLVGLHHCVTAHVMTW
jgi:hypothetical protein